VQSVAVMQLGVVGEVSGTHSHRVVSKRSPWMHKTLSTHVGCASTGATCWLSRSLVIHRRLHRGVGQRWFT
jgi:hypothetical protein